MRILLDECVPWPMHKLLLADDCVTVQKRGWGGIKNGDLLRLAEGEFDLFITSDQNIRYQQNLAGRRIPILELSTQRPSPRRGRGCSNSSRGCRHQARRASIPGDSVRPIARQKLDAVNKTRNNPALADQPDPFTPEFVSQGVPVRLSA